MLNKDQKQKIIMGIMTGAVLALLTGCSTAQTRIMPGEQRHRVVATDYQKDDAEEAAVEVAQEWCEERKLSAVFYKEDDTQYIGTLDEDTTKSVRVASTVGSVFGVKGAHTAGWAATHDSKYKSEMEFSCR